MSAVDIFVATNTVPTLGAGKPFAHGRTWQYHPRSDRHSKTACWAILFDLFSGSTLLQQHAAAGKIGVGINHAVLNTSTGKEKNLDFVIQRIDPDQPKLERNKGAKDFAGLATELDIVLSQHEAAQLAALPKISLLEDPDAPLLVALEAKACMTEHIKSKPRLFDELNSSHALVHGAAKDAISVGWAVINSSPTFVSPLRNGFPLGAIPDVVSSHKKGAAEQLAKHLATLPVVSGSSSAGFDVFGISMVSCANDGTPITKDTDTQVPQGFGYSRFLMNLQHLYATRFGMI